MAAILEKYILTYTDGSVTQRFAFLDRKGKYSTSIASATAVAPASTATEKAMPLTDVGDLLASPFCERIVVYYTDGTGDNAIRRSVRYIQSTGTVGAGGNLLEQFTGSQAFSDGTKNGTNAKAVRSSRRRRRR